MLVISRRGMARLGWVLLTASTLIGCTAVTPMSVSDRLYLGRSAPGGGVVADADWDVFVHEEITPRFPAGLTVWRAQGQWREASGMVAREPVMVLEIVHTRDRAAEVVAIARAYKRRFAQEAVLRVTTSAQADLVE